MRSKLIVKLNVGGKTFVTHRNTLSGSTYFENLLDGELKANKCVNDDQIFIDRSSYLFEYVLQLLRLRIITIEKKKLNSLKQEAEYYQFKDMVAAIEQMQKNTSDLEETFEIMDLNEYFMSVNFHGSTSTTSEPYNTKLRQIIETFEVPEYRWVCRFPHGSKPPSSVCRHDDRDAKNMEVPVSKVILRDVDYKYLECVEDEEIKGESGE